MIHGDRGLTGGREGEGRVWFFVLALSALAEDPPVAPVPAAPTPSTAPTPPTWWTGGCDASLSVPADGKVAGPAVPECAWTGKPKLVRPKEETPPSVACEAWFRSVSGMITGKVAVDEACPAGHGSAIKSFVLGHSWNAPAVHLTVAFTN